MASNFLDKAPTVFIEQNVMHFINAAQAFLICGRWTEAALAYGQAANMYRYELHALCEAAILYTKAGLASEKVEIGQGLDYFSKAVSVYCDCKKYGQAARIRQWIAENHDTNGNHEGAVIEYKMTTQYYHAANMNQQALQCQRKVAYLLGMDGEYAEASQVYQEIGREEMLHNLTKYSAQDSFFRATLLLLAVESCNLDEVKTHLQESIEVDFRFKVSAGCDFLKNIISILKLEDGTVHEFADHMYDYNELYPFDELNLELLDRIYKLHFDALE